METSVNCDWLINELGPPPDAILRIPPPPVPHFMDREYLHEMAQAVLGMSEGDHLHNDSDCHWCHWARRIESTGTISGTTGTEMALEDTWFFVILASCLMLTLGALLSGLVYLRLHGKSFKGTWDFGTFLSETGSILMMSTTTTPTNSAVASSTTGSSASGSNPSGNHSTLPTNVNKPGQQVTRCSVSTYSGDSMTYHHAGSALQPSAVIHPSSSRALWAGVKTCTEGNHYTITHVQPFEQKRSVVQHQQPDEDSAGYTTLHPPASAQVSTDNQIYYCCTDLVMTRIAQPVTSLDDPPVNPLYVNMSAVHPLSPPRRTHPPINPIYPTTSCGMNHQFNPHQRRHLPPTMHVHPSRLYTHQA